MVFFFFKQKTAYEMRISDWSSDVCSSDLQEGAADVLDMDDRAPRRAVALDQHLALAEGLGDQVVQDQVEPHAGRKAVGRCAATEGGGEVFGRGAGAVLPGRPLGEAVRDHRVGAVGDGP